MCKGKKQSIELQVVLVIDIVDEEVTNAMEVDIVSGIKLSSRWKETHYCHKFGTYPQNFYCYLGFFINP